MNIPTQINARFTDGHEEPVTVQMLGIKSLPDYLQRFDDEAKTIELFCDKPDGWADGLAPDSHVELIGAGQDLNLSNLTAWYRRRVARTEMLRPGFEKQLDSAVSGAFKAAAAK